MTAVILKIIACIVMGIDHTAYTLASAKILSNTSETYLLMRTIGRIAFPIYGFLLVEGARYTGNKTRYLLRMTLFALLSEIPFNLVISWKFFNSRYQNVYFTLLAGFGAVCLLQWGSRAGKKRRGLRFGLSLIMAFGLGYAAELLATDYGKQGVWMIAAMGLLNADDREIPLLDALKKKMPVLYDRNVRNFIFAALGILICSYFCGWLEWYSLFALIPILFYNGKKGYAGKGLQYFFYIYYPLHLLLLAAIFVFPRIF